MKEWTNGEVLGWLTHRFGFWGQQYVPIFSNKQVDGQRLSELTKEDLKTEFGVTKPLHLVRMARDIKDASRPIHQINQLIAPLVISNIFCLICKYNIHESPSTQNLITSNSVSSILAHSIFINKDMTHFECVQG